MPIEELVFRWQETRNSVWFSNFKFSIRKIYKYVASRIVETIVLLYSLYKYLMRFVWMKQQRQHTRSSEFKVRRVRSWVICWCATESQMLGNGSRAVREFNLQMWCVHNYQSKGTFKIINLYSIIFPLPLSFLIPPSNHHIVVHIHEYFFLFPQALHPLALPPQLAVILLSIYESVPIFHVISDCSLDSTWVKSHGTCFSLSGSLHLA